MSLFPIADKSLRHLFPRLSIEQQTNTILAKMSSMYQDIIQINCPKFSQHSWASSRVSRSLYCVEICVSGLSGRWESSTITVIFFPFQTAAWWYQWVRNKDSVISPSNSSGQTSAATVSSGLALFCSTDSHQASFSTCENSQTCLQLHIKTGSSLSQHKLRV